MELLSATGTAGQIPTILVLLGRITWMTGFRCYATASICTLSKVVLSGPKENIVLLWQSQAYLSEYEANLIFISYSKHPELLSENLSQSKQNQNKNKQTNREYFSQEKGRHNHFCVLLTQTSPGFYLQAKCEA